ncbi:MAG TPA: CRISPR system precrRNA processing endoribonuclease RAMP protein Cas6 [Streptosporangiaceae bacterium]|nr:CRISPR system precrRNA processing endoribonuclease RAMP protein Cas6 [Streptosporangiaceae bacterium]
MPSRWAVNLAGPSDAPVPLAAPHAVVSRWLDDPPGGQGDGAAASRRSGHGDQARKWAAGPMCAPVFGLEVRLLDDALASRLRSATRAGTPVRLGTAWFEVAEPPRLLAQSSWQELRQWPGTRAWQLRCLTPACFRRGNRTSPWPAPESVARGLADRWRLLHPGTAPAVPAAGSVWVSDLDGRSQVQTLTRNNRRPGGGRPSGEEVISGFTGRIRYACDQGTDEHAAAFNALLAFAAYAGVGSHTTYGFGIIQPEPTWQPPTWQPRSQCKLACASSAAGLARPSG